MSAQITVLMPVYNCENYVGQAIESILNQTFTDFNFLIIDDGSTDKTLEQIQCFSDSRIKIRKNKNNKGLINVLNEAYPMIKTPFIARMDSDDYCDDKRLESQIKFMKDKPEVDVCGTHYSFFGVRNETIYMPMNSSKITLKLLEGCPVLHGSMMIRTNCISKIKFNSNYNYAEDYGMFCDAFPNLKLANINKVLYYYRVENHNTSIVHRRKQLESHEKARKTLLRTLGVQLNNEESSVFHRVVEGQYLLSITELSIYEKVANQIITCNKKIVLFNTELLEKKLKHYFFWSAFYSSRYGMAIYKLYKKSNLNKELSIKHIVEFWIRCLLKIKK
ncbi:hypothetical protein DID74_00850 [Candidatus Marinamargulisbacteria bacterium SCGC AG-333-B06]|nr:hypothetical protein DID74_00850 [Candidatus Marinamargulisbacteria bacterium SCGC AG-333-B06]